MLLQYHYTHLDLHAFPTRRSSDLNLEKVFIHAFLDGRDVGPQTAIDYIQQLEEEMEKLEIGEIATVYSLWQRSEEHTSELQSRGHLVCRLLHDKKKIHT